MGCVAEEAVVQEALSDADSCVLPFNQRCRKEAGNCKSTADVIKVLSVIARTGNSGLGRFFKRSLAATASNSLQSPDENSDLLP